MRSLTARVARLTPSTRRLLDGVAVRFSHRSCRPIHTPSTRRCGGAVSPVGTRRWRATYNDANTVKRHIGYFDDQEAAALAVNKAIIDAGLAGLRRMNEIDEDGMPVPRPWGGGD